MIGLVSHSKHIFFIDFDPLSSIYESSNRLRVFRLNSMSGHYRVTDEAS